MTIAQKFRRIALGLSLALATAAAAPADNAGIGQPARAFTVTTFARQKVKLADLRGKVVVLNYWATWCGPCKHEMPMMDAVNRRFHEQGLEIFAVTTEDSVPPYQLQRVASLLSFPLATRLAGSGYGTIGGAVPTSYVIDRSGTLRYARAGAFTLDSFQSVILPLLREPAPAG
jgi:cytochrome c biogenesis protein CcmG/thiol:disulfide interchange protein DsbE